MPYRGHIKWQNQTVILGSRLDGGGVTGEETGKPLTAAQDRV